MNKKQNQSDEFREQFRNLFQNEVSVHFVASVSSLSDSDVEIADEETDNEEKSNLESKNYALSLLDLHPGSAKFSDLAQKMSKIEIEDLKHIKGILGHVEEGYYMRDETVESDLNLIKRKVRMEAPPEGAVVWVHSALYLEDQTDAIDNSKLKGKPHIFKLLESETLPGILVACRYLRTGQRGKFLLPSSTMYGDLGCPPSIPPSATILMLIHLLKWIDVGASRRYDSLEDNSKKNFQGVKIIIENINEVAADYYNRYKYGQAFELYEKLISILSYVENEEHNLSEIDQQKYRTYLNLAICKLKLDDPAQSISLLDEASLLGDFKKDSKYFFTRGRCLAMLNKIEEALEFFLQALELKPNNVEIGKELLKIDKIIANNKNTENVILKKMLKNDKLQIKQGDMEEIKSYIDDILGFMESKTIDSMPISSTLVTEDIKKINEIINDKKYRIISVKLPNGKFNWVFTAIKS